MASTPSDLYECLILCVASQVCEALVFDPKSKFPCWFHIGHSGSLKEEDLIPMEGSVVYLLDKSCVLPEGLNVSQSEHKAEICAPKNGEYPIINHLGFLGDIARHPVSWNKL